MAFAIECAAMLTLCFWWYNNTALVLAAVFFLSCLAYEKQSDSVAIQASYFASLVLLSLMKPNIAGAMISGAFVLLLIVSEARLRLLLLTAAATVCAVLLLIANHISISAMISSYLSVAKERGTVTERFGFREMEHWDRAASVCWLSIVAVPILTLFLRMPRHIREGKWKLVIYDLFFPLALLVALYGLMTNGDFRDVECSVLLASGAVLIFGVRSNRIFRRVFIAIVCASIAADLYFGALRVRVYSVGPGMFYQWQDNEHRVRDGFLKDMRVGSGLIELEREVGLVKEANPGPYFFGPRIDFNYAVFGLPSPEHFPAWWHPGTAFETSKQSEIIDAWKKDGFETLIFLNSNDQLRFSYYPQSFLDAIHEEYVEDRSYPSLTVFHRRSNDPLIADQPTRRSVSRAGTITMPGYRSSGSACGETHVSRTRGEACSS